MPDPRSAIEQLADLPEAERVAFVEGLSETELYALQWDWRLHARPKQVAPAGDWATWIVRAGRGWGKTRTGGGWIDERAQKQPGRWMALIAKTPADARDYMIEGPGGIKTNVPEDRTPLYEPSKRRLTWPNGSWATIYSSEEPDQLRGFSGDTAWLDEFAKWKNPRECWDNLQYGMREVSGDRPRQLITTTPRPIDIMREIEARPTTVTVTGSSYENRANLAPEWFAETLSVYEGTRLGRQEIHAEYMDDVPGALWTREMVERARWRESRFPDMSRIVVAIDPAASVGEHGIIVAGMAECMCKGRPETHGFVLDDETLAGSPDEWGRTAVAAYAAYDADRIVAEVNNGGDMVEHVVRTQDPSVAYRDVRASRGKKKRAEPVAALYEQGKVHHAEPFPELEDQMCTWVPEDPGDSPDRCDALVWALTDLMVTGARPAPAVAAVGGVSASRWNV